MTAPLGGDATIAQAILKAIEQVVGPANGRVALHEPSFSGVERELVMACLDSGYVSSVGAYVDEFEARLREFTGAKHAVVVVNGTAALQVALTLAGVEPGDEVLVPSLTFVATANAVKHCGAFPHFVDSNTDTLGLDPAALDEYLKGIVEATQGVPRNRETGARISAVVPMHAFGHPVDLAGLIEVAARHRIPIVEDAAESLGSTYQGRHTGTFGLLGTLSFNGNKLVTTGGGGAILTDDPELARHAKHLTTTAKRPHRWEFFHDEVAWNYRLPNLNAALGCAQMERLPDFLARKRLLADRYQAALQGCRGVQFVPAPSGTVSNYWLNTLRLATPDLATRDTVLAATNDAGYQCRPVWGLLHQLPMFEDAPRAPLTVAERLRTSLINVPSSPQLVQDRSS